MLMAERVRLIDWHIAPTIFRIERHVALFQQKLDAFQVALGCGQMQCRAAIVVAQRDVHAGQFVAAQRSHIAAGRRKQQVHNGQPLGLVAMTTRILLVTSMLQVIVRMEVERADEFLWGIGGVGMREAVRIDGGKVQSQLMAKMRQSKRCLVSKIVRTYLTELNTSAAVACGMMESERANYIQSGQYESSILMMKIS